MLGRGTNSGVESTCNMGEITLFSAGLWIHKMKGETSWVHTFTFQPAQNYTFSPNLLLPPVPTQPTVPRLDWFQDPDTSLPQKPHVSRHHILGSSPMSPPPVQATTRSCLAHCNSLLWLVHQLTFNPLPVCCQINQVMPCLYPIPYSTWTPFEGPFTAQKKRAALMRGLEEDRHTPHFAPVSCILCPTIQT